MRSTSAARTFAPSTARSRSTSATPTPCSARSRTGSVWYQQCGPGDARMRVTFDQKIDGKKITPEKIEYLLDKGWLEDRDYQKRDRGPPAGPAAKREGQPAEARRRPVSPADRPEEGRGPQAVQGGEGQARARRPAGHDPPRADADPQDPVRRQVQPDRRLDGPPVPHARPHRHHRRQGQDHPLDPPRKRPHQSRPGRQGLRPPRRSIRRNGTSTSSRSKNRGSVTGYLLLVTRGRLPIERPGIQRRVRFSGRVTPIRRDASAEADPTNVATGSRSKRPHE